MKPELKIIKKENQELKKEIEKLKDLVTIDFLTQVYNRHAFSHFLKSACKEVKWTAEHMSRRQRREYFSLLLIDIDDFKKFNDKFGHLYGDKILKKTAKFLQDSVRDFDIVARWGGEEFAIILQEATLEQAKKRAEIILKNCQKKLPLTFSIGVIGSNPKYSATQIFKKVDKALLKAKKRGKNQIIVE
ncbi:MAG: GGDEF domain-containing protein [Patescibacteria group bacterium]